MPGNYLIGIDVGTQGTKTSLISVDGRLIAEAFEASRIISPARGVVQQEPEEMYSSVLNTISEVVHKSKVNPTEVAAIGVDAQMAGILGIDRDWNPVTYYDSWLDTRCEKYIKEIKEAAEEKVVSITGCPVTYAHGPKVLWWKNERPDVYRKVDKFILPSTYIVGRLSGLKSDDAYIDYTHLHFSGYGDTANNSWSQELLDMFKIDREKMPDVVEPWRVAGGLTKEAARQSSLIPGIPVAAGCGDSAATALGAGITRKGLMFDVAGTASIFSCCVDEFKPDVDTKALLFAHSVIPGLWAPMAYINGGGMCLKWFRDNLTGADKVSYAELDRSAENIVPGSDGLVFIPHFSGRVCPNNPNIRGSWIGLSWIHGSAHLYRAIMEGIAYEYSYYFKVLKGLVDDASFSRVIAIGGGARSRVFNAIKSDVLGVKYSTRAAGDTATLGSAIIAGFGAGIFSDLAGAADSFVKVAQEVEPNLINHEEYKKYSRAYERVLHSLGPAFECIVQ